MRGGEEGRKIRGRVSATLEAIPQLAKNGLFFFEALKRTSSTSSLKTGLYFFFKKRIIFRPSSEEAQLCGLLLNGCREVFFCVCGFPKRYVCFKRHRLTCLWGFSAIKVMAVSMMLFPKTTGPPPLPPPLKKKNSSYLWKKHFETHRLTLSASQTCFFQPPARYTQPS